MDKIGTLQNMIDESKNIVFFGGAGTSLTVQPASGLVSLFKGKYLVIINDTKTSYDDMATLIINDNLTKVFSKLK